jgi:RHS repeat-associated protein
MDRNSNLIAGQQILTQDGALRFVVGERAFAGLNDDNGNMVARIVDGSAIMLSYDAENRLMSVTGGVSANFVYDGDGKRVKSVINTNLTIVYLGDYYEYELLNDETITQRFYYYAGRTRVAMRTGINPGTLDFLFGDHLGSTSITTDSNGVNPTELRYYPWGGVRYSSGTTPKSFQFTRQRWESSFNLYYYGARWYDSYLNRWIQPDVIIPDPNNSQSYDRYAYK